MDDKLKLLASRFTKIEANRTEDYEGKLSMNTDIRITSIKETDDDNDAVKINYVYKIDYSELGKIEVTGYMFIGASKDTVDMLVSSWDDKKFDTPEHAAITNLILQKASIKAFELEEELGLPIHIKLPTVTLNKEE